mgnify:CR=1 FL=1
MACSKKVSKKATKAMMGKAKTKKMKKTRKEMMY